MSPGAHRAGRDSRVAQVWYQVAGAVWVVVAAMAGAAVPAARPRDAVAAMMAAAMRMRDMGVSPLRLAAL